MKRIVLLREAHLVFIRAAPAMNTHALTCRGWGLVGHPVPPPLSFSLQQFAAHCGTLALHKNISDKREGKTVREKDAQPSIKRSSCCPPAKTDWPRSVSCSSIRWEHTQPTLPRRISSRCHVKGCYELNQTR